MKYGYARISHSDQNLGIQFEQLNSHGVDEIVSETITGVAKEKPKLENLITRLQKNDTLVVTRMDRLGRNTIQLLQLVEEFIERGIHLEILDLGITPTSRMGKTFLTIMAALAENERELIKEKQRHGIQLAKQQGKYKGRLKKYTGKHEGMNHAIELYKEGNKTVKQICSITKVSRSALYRQLDELGVTR
jgi:DNA invertase Pin-like site-specific DNA recombinase